MPEDALSEEQDLTFVFAELHKISVEPFLQFFEVALNGSPPIQNTSHSPLFSFVHSSNDVAFCLMFQTADEDIKLSVSVLGQA